MQTKQSQITATHYTMPNHFCLIFFVLQYTHYAAVMIILLNENACRIYMLKCAEERKERLSEAIRGMPMRKVSRLEAGTPNDFLVVGLGVLVAVKSPVRTSVVVVTI